ncbi:craniofacial development 2-like protein [Labeo rohita]|uniref:Craniofacial development 2-like protein n=1 Tax=Labeo rohita TaxID=84645 RepID=A0A498LNV8_LABRO|nr:craniofacial development 2-like protein [Labeo rohita]RXN16377.1 craniofacial development 2-like protein [Labeo rohita]
MTTKPRCILTIAIDPRWRTPCLQDVCVHRGADICSDYHLTITKFKVKLKRKKKKDSKPQQFDRSKLNDDRCPVPAVLSNRFSALADLVPGSLDWWDQLKDAMSPAGEEILGHKKSFRETWIGDRTWELIAERKALHQRRFSSSDGKDAYQEYIKNDKAVKKVVHRGTSESGWTDKLRKLKNQLVAMTCAWSTRSPRRSAAL